VDTCGLELTNSDQVYECLDVLILEDSEDSPLTQPIKFIPLHLVRKLVMILCDPLGRLEKLAMNSVFSDVDANGGIIGCYLVIWFVLRIQFSWGTQV
jgi:hypothetical protein